MRAAMPRSRQPGAMALVLAGHALLAWALLSLRPVLPPHAGLGQASPGLVMLRLGLPQSLARQAAAPPSPRPLAMPQPAAALPPMRADAASLAPVGTMHAATTDAPAAPSMAEPAGAAAPTLPAAPAEPPGGTLSASTSTTLTVIAQADHRQCSPAAHPAALRERGIEGAVTLRIKVDVQGRPADVQLLAGSGWRLFDEAALQQARGCRFFPATRGGQAIDSWVEFPVRFTLTG